MARGARAILIRPAPVPGFRGPRSFALPEFDPVPLPVPGLLEPGAEPVPGAEAKTEKLPAQRPTDLPPDRPV